MKSYLPSKTVLKLFALVPEKIKSEAIEATTPDPKGPWKNVGCKFINFDADFQDFFVSPFFYQEVTEDNQATVAYVQYGELLPVETGC